MMISKIVVTKRMMVKPNFNNRHHQKDDGYNNNDKDLHNQKDGGKINNKTCYHQKDDGHHNNHNYHHQSMMVIAINSKIYITKRTMAVTKRMMVILIKLSIIERITVRLSPKG